MAEQNVIRTIRIRGTAEGLDQLTGKLNSLASAQQNVAVVSEESARRQLSLEQAWKRQALQLDESARMQHRMAQATKLNDDALKQGTITQQQHADRIALISRSLTTAKAANDNFTQSLKPARFELINMSRQVQDIGVSLAGGQSPFQVLIQQGTQIADIFAASNATVGSFFRTSIGWAGRFITSAAGITSGIVGIGAAALYMGQSFASSQREIDKALSGIGAASGLTRGGVNQVAGQAASPFGLSVSEARAAAAAFIATGKIYGDNVRQATQLTHAFAVAMGVDAADAAKRLGKDLQDPVAAAVEWNKTLGFLDSNTLDYIQSLVSMGRRQDAIGALILEAAPAIGRAAEQTSIWAKAWSAVANFASDAATSIGQAVERGVERTTGIEGRGFTDEDRLAGALSRRDAASGALNQGGLGPRAVQGLRKELEEASREVAKFEQRLADVAKRAESGRFAQMSLEARDFARSVNEGTAQIERLSQGLATIEKLQAERLNRGGAADPGLEQAAQLARVQLATALELEQTEIRKAQVLSQNAIKYQDTSIAIANQRELLDAQLTVAQAITGVAQIEAQHHLTIVTLKQQGLELSDATRIADEQRAIALAQVNADADRTLRTLREQGEVIRASSEDERERIRAQQEYNRLIEQGVESMKAGAIASQMIENARSERDAREQAQADQDAARAAKDQARALDNAAAASERMAAASAEAQRRWEQAAEDLKNLPFYLLDAMGAMDKLFNSNQGGKSQFNPEGYEFSRLTPLGQFAQNVYGTGGYDDTGKPNSQGLTNMVNTYLAGGKSIATYQWMQGGGVMGAIEGLLSGRTSGGGASFGSSGLSADVLGLVSQLTDLLPDDQKASVVERELSLLRSQPQNLETMQAIKQLTDSLDQLKQATDANTQAMTDVLSPFYSSDPRQTRLGFRAFGTGGVAMSETYARIAENEPEVVAPLSQLPSILAGISRSSAANSNQPIVIKQTVNVYGQVSSDQARKTGFQLAQSQRRAIAAG